MWKPSGHGSKIFLRHNIEQIVKKFDMAIGADVSRCSGLWLLNFFVLGEVNHEESFEET